MNKNSFENSRVKDVLRLGPSESVEKPLITQPLPPLCLCNSSIVDLDLAKIPDGSGVLVFWCAGVLALCSFRVKALEASIQS